MVGEYKIIHSCHKGLKLCIRSSFNSSFFPCIVCCTFVKFSIAPQHTTSLVFSLKGIWKGTFVGSENISPLTHSTIRPCNHFRDEYCCICTHMPHGASSPPAPLLCLPNAFWNAPFLANTCTLSLPKCATNRLLAWLMTKFVGWLSCL